MAEPKFGGWAVDSALIQRIYDILPAGKTVLELGSGDGSTPALAKRYEVISIEDKGKWVGRHPGVTYIHAPARDHKAVRNHTSTRWYDSGILRQKLAGLTYDLILIDGPACGRAGFLKYADLFNLDVPIVIDDLQRFRDYKIAVSLSARLRRPFNVEGQWEGKPFGVMLP